MCAENIRSLGPKIPSLVDDIQGSQWSFEKYGLHLLILSPAMATLPLSMFMKIPSKSASRLMEGPYFQAPTAQKETITQWRWVQAAILKTESPVQHQLFCDLVHALKRNLFLRTGHTAVNFLHTNETIFLRCTY